MRSPRLVALALVLFGSALAVRGASAANGAKPRVPVIWTAGECATIVDRGTTPVVHFDYMVPNEEDPDERTADEVDDSRTHQFFAFAKEDGKAALPTWISHADILRASMVDPEVIDANIDPEDILEETSRFAADEWVRITADDARVPITFAQAAMGVDWDVSAAAPGTYQVVGYTWEPVRNLWSPRPGFVKVIASAAEAEAAGPSIALNGEQAAIAAGSSYTPAGCADVPEGSTLLLEWGEVIGTAEPDWQVALQDEPISSGALTFVFVPPDEAGGTPVKSIKLRATVTDPAGRSYTSYQLAVLSVSENPNPSDDGGGGGGCSIPGNTSATPLLALLLLALRRRRALVVATLGLGCASDDASQDTDATTTADTGTETGDTGVVPSEGLLACPAPGACTLVIVAQAFDDRVEVYAPRGAGPAYRGAIDLDLKPNPLGDNSGDFLDEPYGMVVDDVGLTISVGHYPQRDRGSLIVFPHETLAAQAAGTTLPIASYFAGAAFLEPVRSIDAAATEAIFMIGHPSGRQLVGVFANDLFTPDADWTNPGELLVVDPATGELGRRALTGFELGDCEGAWSLVALDDAVSHVALACDGNEGAVILDTSALGEGTVVDAAAAIDGCFADTPFPDKRVRYLARDGEGGILLAENTPVATFEPGRMYRFDADCTQTYPMASEIPGELWEVRQIVALPSDVGPRWLMATGLTDGRGVHVVKDDGMGPEICAKLDDLEPWWTATDGSDVHPYAMTLDRSGTGLAIGAGPPEAAKDMPGYGRVLWVELSAGDPCESSPVKSAIDLTDEAPPVAADDPSTWRRGPNVVVVKDYG